MYLSHMKIKYPGQRTLAKIAERVAEQNSQCAVCPCEIDGNMLRHKFVT